MYDSFSIKYFLLQMQDILILVLLNFYINNFNDDEILILRTWNHQF
jgi:hypothetical protein